MSESGFSVVHFEYVTNVRIDDVLVFQNIKPGPPILTDIHIPIAWGRDITEEYFQGAIQVQPGMRIESAITIGEMPRE